MIATDAREDDSGPVDITCRCPDQPPVEFLPLFAAWQCSVCKRAVPYVQPILPLSE